jgi:hypothetical protein
VQIVFAVVFNVFIIIIILFLFFLQLQHSSLVSKEEIDYMITDFWGPFLVERSADSTDPFEMNTFWGDVIGKYSDIAVPSLEYLAGW